MIKIPGYEISQRIHEGEHTLVYSGVRLSDNKQVILKILKGDNISAYQVAKFKREFYIIDNVLNGLSVECLEFRSAENLYIIITEMFGDTNLQSLIYDKPLPLKDIINLVLKILN